jgi:flagellar biosynthesis anti-sigma factor FlgM
MEQKIQNKALKNESSQALSKAENDQKLTQNTSKTLSQDTDTQTAPSADQAAIEALAQASPDIREARVAALKRKIQSGEYDIEAEDLAEKLLKDHLDTKEIG